LAALVYSGGFRPGLEARAVYSFVKGRQLCAIIGDEDGEQACRLRRTRVLADEVFAAGRLEKALAAL
jgi:hypothetical protein